MLTTIIKNLPYVLQPLVMGMSRSINMTPRRHVRLAGGLARRDRGGTVWFSTATAGKPAR
jgi:hypothetical protein